MTRFIATDHDSIYDTDFDFVASKTSLKARIDSSLMFSNICRNMKLNSE